MTGSTDSARRAGERDALRLIASGCALSAEAEALLEERGLIVQTDQPYATITPAGRALLDERSE